MNIVNFESKTSKVKRSLIVEAVKLMKESTNFILITSMDNCDSTEFLRFNVNPTEAIGAMEVTKHYILHEVIPQDEPTGHEDDICAEGGK